MSHSNNDNVTEALNNHSDNNNSIGFTGLDGAFSYYVRKRWTYSLF